MMIARKIIPGKTEEVCVFPFLEGIHIIRAAKGTHSYGFLLSLMLHTVGAFSKPHSTGSHYCHYLGENCLTTQHMIIKSKAIRGLWKISQKDSSELLMINIPVQEGRLWERTIVLSRQFGIEVTALCFRMLQK